MSRTPEDGRAWRIGWPVVELSLPENRLDERYVLMTDNPEDDAVSNSALGGAVRIPACLPGAMLSASFEQTVGPEVTAAGNLLVPSDV
jgi:hypothetical protein